MTRLTLQFHEAEEAIQFEGEIAKKLNAEINFAVAMGRNWTGYVKVEDKVFIRYNIDLIAAIEFEEDEQ